MGRYRKYIIVAILIVGVAIFMVRCGFVGCVYTEEVLPAPKELVEAKIVVFGQAYLAKGHDPDYGCLPVFGKIEREIVGPMAFNMSPNWKEDIIRRGRTVEPLARGTEFKVTGILKMTKHGITTIDSGRGPFYFLILKDKDGLEYQVYTIETGINDQDRFLQYVPASEKPGEPMLPKLLGSNSFKRGSDNFSFTGARP